MRIPLRLLPPPTGGAECGSDALVGTRARPRCSALAMATTATVAVAAPRGLACLAKPPTAAHALAGAAPRPGGPGGALVVMTRRPGRSAHIWGTPRELSMRKTYGQEVWGDLGRSGEIWGEIGMRRT